MNAGKKVDEAIAYLLLFIGLAGAYLLHWLEHGSLWLELNTVSKKPFLFPEIFYDFGMERCFTDSDKNKNK